MAEFRNIHTRIWADAWFSGLSPEEKLLFVYLFSNPSASVCGMYELPLRTMALDTGIPADRVSAILDTFAGAGKVFYEDGIVWVVNLRKYNSSGDSVKVLERIRKDLEVFGETNLKRRYLAHYGYTLSAKLDTLSKKVERDETRRDETRQDETRRDGDPLAVSPSEDEFDQMRRLLETLTGVLPSGPEAVQAIQKLTEEKVTETDIRAGLDWLKSQGKVVRYYGSLVGPVLTAKAKRIQGGNGHKSVKENGRRTEIYIDADGNPMEIPV
jgi:hypothetical protein